MEQCRISPSKTVGGLSERQRTELLASSEAEPSPAVFVVSGPSGAGKGTVIALVSQRLDRS